MIKASSHQFNKMSYITCIVYNKAIIFALLPCCLAALLPCCLAALLPYLILQILQP